MNAKGRHVASDLALQLCGVDYAIGSRGVLRGVDIDVPHGSVFVLLGPNGAGKTTTLKLAVGLLPLDAGRVLVGGRDRECDPLAAKRELAYIPDEPVLYDLLTTREYIEFVATLWDTDPATVPARVEGVLLDLGLQEFADARLGTMSRGYRQKAALAAALAHGPSLLVMDEPLTGLDPIAARQTEALLGRIARAGTSVLMSTHLLDTAQRLATHMAILSDGRVLAQGTVAEVCAAGRRNGSIEDFYLDLLGAAPR